MLPGGHAGGAERSVLHHHGAKPSPAAQVGGSDAPVVLAGQRRELGRGEEEDVDPLDERTDLVRPALDEDGHRIGADQRGSGLIEHGSLQARVHARDEEDLGLARALGQHRLPLGVAARLRRLVRT